MTTFKPIEKSKQAIASRVHVCLLNILDLKTSTPDLSHGPHPTSFHPALDKETKPDGC